MNIKAKTERTFYTCSHRSYLYDLIINDGFTTKETLHQRNVSFLLTFVSFCPTNNGKFYAKEHGDSNRFLTKLL